MLDASAFIAEMSNAEYGFPQSGDGITVIGSEYASVPSALRTI